MNKALEKIWDETKLGMCKAASIGFVKLTAAIFTAFELIPNYLIDVIRVKYGV